jgi:hypothetical protein
MKERIRELETETRLIRAAFDGGAMHPLTYNTNEIATNNQLITWTVIS